MPLHLWLPVAILIVAAVAVFFFGTGMVKNHQGGPSSGGNAFGGFDVFDPGKERADRDLDAMEHQIVVTPKAGSGPRGVDVDKNAITIRRPTTRNPTDEG